MIKYNLKILSLIIAIIGIIILLLFLNISEPKPMKISSINEKQLNKQVKIQGTLIKATTLKEDFTALAIKSFNNSEKIEAVCDCYNMKYYINKTISLIGRISEYNNQLQIQADKIILIEIN